MFIQNKCARERGQGYGIKCVGIYHRKSASVWKRVLKDVSPGKRAGGCVKFCELLGHVEYKVQGLKC